MVTIQLDIPGNAPDTASSEPVCVVDERTKQVYYLISAEQFEQVRSLFIHEEFQPREMYLLISQTAAEAGWADPQMDDYDRYDEIRPIR
jgi:hypothetical protein